MKFTRLSTKSDKLINKKVNGAQINPKNVEKLQRQLSDKKSHYEIKLKTELSTEKRSSLETKLKVVNAQLDKYKLLLSDQSN